MKDILEIINFPRESLFTTKGAFSMVILENHSSNNMSLSNDMSVSNDFLWARNDLPGIFDRKKIFTLDLKRFDQRECLYLTAIKNLRKKINYIQLNFEYQNDDITEEEYERELIENEDKYLIDVKLLKNQQELDTLNEIISKLNENLTLDDISEIFSVDINTKPPSSY